MATRAVAQETVCALRREIANIEGTAGCIADFHAASAGPRSEPDAAAAGFADPALPGGLVATDTRLDFVLGGGVPQAALIEVHGAAEGDAGAAAGFSLALATLASGPEQALPLLWVGTSEGARESGFPYMPGIHAGFGLRNLLLSCLPRLDDALWVAEEAAGLGAFGGVILAVRSTSSKLDLTATRRLHMRARRAGRMMLLLRLGAGSTLAPTASPVRLSVSPAPAGMRRVLGRPLARSLGNPAFRVTVSKSRTAREGELILEWSPDDQRFHESQDFGAVVSPSRRRTHLARAEGAVLAFDPGRNAATSGNEPEDRECLAPSFARRAG